MTALIDVCVLLAAHRADHPHHDRGLEVVDDACREGLLWCSHTRNGFLRLATHPRIFAQPTPPAMALAAWQAWSERPESRLLVESAASDRHFQRLCRQRQAIGNAVYDLHLAALALADDAELWSFDDDFEAVSELRFRQV
jgi:toxin-antitoxin system PIN domain toxin